MPKYTVHIYAVARVPVEVEAESMEGAIKKAEEKTNLYDVLDSEKASFAEEVTGYLVDVEGDEGCENSRYFNTDDLTSVSFRFLGGEGSAPLAFANEGDGENERSWES